MALPHSPATRLAAFKQALELLACPVCHGCLLETPEPYVTCAGCGRRYPLVDGIPILLADRATLAEES